MLARAHVPPCELCADPHARLTRAASLGCVTFMLSRCMTREETPRINEDGKAGTILQTSTRKPADNCSDFQGFLLFNAVPPLQHRSSSSTSLAGTGSGLGAHVLERLAVDYGRKWNFSISIYRRRRQVRALDPLNIASRRSA